MSLSASFPVIQPSSSSSSSNAQEQYPPSSSDPPASASKDKVEPADGGERDELDEADDAEPVEQLQRSDQREGSAPVVEEQGRDKGKKRAREEPVDDATVAAPTRDGKFLSSCFAVHQLILA